MAIAWFFCPVVEEIGPDGTRRRRPKVADLRDPGTDLIDEIDPVTELPTGNKVHQKYSFSAAISDGLPGQDNDWCLVQVRGIDLSVVKNDPEITELEIEYDESERESRIESRADAVMAAPARARLQSKAAARGISMTPRPIVTGKQRDRCP